MTPPDRPSAASQALLANKRACVAELMDAHPGVFPCPSGAANWTDFVARSMTAVGRDRRTIDQAISRLIDVIRTAQVQDPSPNQLVTVMAELENKGPSLAPDPRLLALTNEESDPSETHALGQFVTLYKQLRVDGVANGDELHRKIESSFDVLPAVTPLMRDLVSTARRLSLMDLDFVLDSVH